jgi:peptidoglycan/LPS O-acetylase OafA/YrhL
MNTSELRTLGRRLQEAGGSTSGFDYLRLGLAVSVVCWHSVTTLYGLNAAIEISKDWVGYAVFMVMPMFFALSGFLVSSSLLRSKSIWVFLGLRGLRIFPALCVEICLSALLIGPLLTTLDLRAYFSDPMFHSYFLNICGDIHYNLPGVFESNPLANIVNNPLWTIPFEMECYIALFVLAVLGFAKRPWAMLGVVMALSVAAILYKYLIIQTLPPVGPNASGRQLVVFFLGGVALFMLRDKIPHSLTLFVASLIAALLLVKTPRFVYLAPLPVAYLTAYIGLLNFRRLPVVFSGDYSYGIYLYAFPMQQCVVQFFPQIHTWYLHFMVSLVPVSLFAVFSWHCIEKPLLRLKRLLVSRPPAPMMVEEVRPDAEFTPTEDPSALEDVAA